MTDPGPDLPPAALFACCGDEPGSLPLSRRSFLLGSLATGAAGCAGAVVRTPKEEVARFPLIDMHSHLLPVSQRPDVGFTPADLLKAMDQAGIKRMIVVGFGSEVPELPRRYPGRFVAAYIQYNFRTRQDPSMLGRLPDRFRITSGGTAREEVDRIGGEFEEALQSGLYRALAEITTIARPIHPSVLGTRTAAPGAEVSPDSPLVRRLVELAGRYEVPINIHCEDYAAGLMVSAVRAYPRTRIIWAHTGSYQSPGAIRELLGEHPNLSFDLSSKNPLYGRAAAIHPMLGLGGIDETWRQLFEAYPDRFFLGVDFLTAGMLARAREVGDYYRTILTQLTPSTARKVGYENAVKAYDLG